MVSELFSKSFSTGGMLIFFSKNICRIAGESSNFAVRNVE
jgi:hypothetical protein